MIRVVSLVALALLSLPSLAEGDPPAEVTALCARYAECQLFDFAPPVEDPAATTAACIEARQGPYDAIAAANNAECDQLNALFLTGSACNAALSCEALTDDEDSCTTERAAFVSLYFQIGETCVAGEAPPAAIEGWNCNRTYYGGDDGFVTMFQAIEMGARALVATLKTQGRAEPEQ